MLQARGFVSVLSLGCAALLVGLLWAQDNPPAKPAPPRADLGSLFPDVTKLAQANSFRYSFLGDHFKTFAEHQSASRAKIFELLLHRPDKVDPKPELVARVEMPDHIRETILFSTTPQFRVPAYVLIPKNLKKPAPAIVDLHSHGGMFLWGKEKVVDLGAGNHPAMTAYHERNYDGRPTATELVKRGYVVIVIDAFFFGDRRVMLAGDAQHGWDRSKYTLEQVKYLNQQCRSKETTLVKGLTFAGCTWPGVVFWDDIRTVDYLVTRPEVDPQRIGCVGISMGGYRSLFLAGLDERIKAACVVGFMSTIEPMIQGHLDTHSNIHFLPGLHRYLDWPDVVALHAPQPLLVQQCSQDGLFPLAGMQQSIEKIAALYKKAGVPEQFTGRFYDVPHRWTRAMQDDAFAWLDQHLKK